MDKTLRARVALTELREMGLTVADLVAASPGQVSEVSETTLAEFLPSVSAAYQPRTRRTYNSYWMLAAELLGDKPLAVITVEDVTELVAEAGRRAQLRRPGSDGRASRESCVAATRALFARALKAGKVSSNPALLVDKPRRLPNRRRALSPAELDELWEAVTATTRDPELDLLLLRFHLESGARRMGAINLRIRDIDSARQTVWLREKFGVEREQPISASLVESVLDLGAARGAFGPDDTALRTRRRVGGRHAAVTDRTYDRIFSHAQECVVWSERTPLTAHVLRHTAITAVERIAGFAVAQAFAGHRPSSVTGTYAKAEIGEVASAVAALTGEPHPLAHT